MTKLSVVLYYWIFVIAAIIIAKLAGFADDNSAIIKVLIIVTILYVGIMMVYSTSKKAQSKARQLSKSKKQQSNRNLSGQPNKPNHSKSGKKKK